MCMFCIVTHQTEFTSHKIHFTCENLITISGYRYLYTLSQHTVYTISTVVPVWIPIIEKLFHYFHSNIYNNIINKTNWYTICWNIHRRQSQWNRWIKCGECVMIVRFICISIFIQYRYLNSFCVGHISVQFYDNEACAFNNIIE